MFQICLGNVVKRSFKIWEKYWEGWYIGYFPVAVINTTVKTTYKKGLLWAYSSRRLRVHHHQIREGWQQAPGLVIGARVESSHLWQQTGSAERTNHDGGSLRAANFVQQGHTSYSFPNTTNSGPSVQMLENGNIYHPNTARARVTF